MGNPTSEGSASEPSLARRVSMCKDAKLSCRGNKAQVGNGGRNKVEGDDVDLNLSRVTAIVGT